MADRNNQQHSTERGQSLIEYALILVLVVMALTAAVVATGPALGNIFSNTVYNLIGITGTPQNMQTLGGPDSFWKTVTAVALNPPQDRGFPPNPPQPPSATPTDGPSPTPSPTVPTKTPTPTFTPPPTSTPADFSFVAPFEDPINNPEWWRVDQSVYLGGEGWRGQYFNGRNLDTAGAVADYNLWNASLPPINTYTYDLNFLWNDKGPIENWNVDEFSVRWTRNVTNLTASNMTINVSIQADDGVRFYLDNTVVAALSNWNTSCMDCTTLSSTITLTPGAHALKVEYFEATGSAGIIVKLTQPKGNVPADRLVTGSGVPNCPFTQISGTQPNSLSYAWKESAATNTTGFSTNMRCHLELRGYVDVRQVTNPVMNWWEVWDFQSQTTVSIQFGEYAPYSYNPDGTVVTGSGPSWQTATQLRTGTTKNYAWSRAQVAIPTFPSGKVAYRFIVESTSATGVRRWFMDDIRIDGRNSGTTFGVCTVDKASCGSYWNLDSVVQKKDFITSARWDLTTTNAATNENGSASMSWDPSSGPNNGTYSNFGSQQPQVSPVNRLDLRVHYIELNGQVSLPLNANGTGGTPDYQGDDGYPQLSFTYAYDLDVGDSIEIQYTRDAIDTVDDTWTTLQVLQQVSRSGSAISGPMDEIEVPLQTISNWNTSPFRLRFALLVDRDNNSRDGLFLDNIRIDRKGVSRFSSYPFCDGAENGAGQWLMQGQWGTIAGGAVGSGRAFTDSPGGNYAQQQTSMELRYPIDFNNDTPENLNVWGGNKDCSGAASSAATKPMLSLWHWRRLAANDSFYVDLFRNASTQSGTAAIAATPVWSWVYSSNTLNREQMAWERFEVDLQGAIEQVTGLTWTALRTNADPRDDDFYIAIRLDARSDASSNDGITLDNITISNYTEVVHKLWNTTTSVTALTGSPTAGTGNGPRYVDDIDAPADWWSRWTLGGQWTGIDWEQHSGTWSLHDSPPQSTTYLHATNNVLEMNRIIDLRGTLTTDAPTLYFWTRFDIGDSDTIRVDIAQQSPYEMTKAPIPPSTTASARRTRMGYNYFYDWGSTTAYNVSSSFDKMWTRGPNVTQNTWGREQIDLRQYADDPATTTVNEGERIRIRFVLDATQSAARLLDGWYIDDIRIEFRQPRVFGLPFFDAAQNTSNWVTEGSWGLAPDYWRGSGGGPAALGPSTYNYWFFDCIQWMMNPARTAPQTGDTSAIVCTTSNTDTFLNAIPRTIAGTANWLTSRAAWTTPNYYLSGTVTSVNNDFGTSTRPTGAATGRAGRTWDNHFMGRWIRPISVQSGEFTFITTSDDGVRVRYETPTNSAPAGWNIINNWTTHGRTVNLATVSLVAGDYTLVMEWFEYDGSAAIILQVGNNNFSFSDSPKAGAGDTFPQVMSTSYGNSSLLLDGVLNLNNPGIATALWIPRLYYYTYYDLGSGASARVEVSIDGGFTWIQTNLGSNCPTGVSCNSTISGTTSRLPTGSNPQDWQLRSSDLRTYVNKNIGLRFRLVTGSDVRDGWWITDLQVNN